MNQKQMSQNLKSLVKRRREIYALESTEKTNALSHFGKQATDDVGDTDSGSDLAEQEVALTLMSMESIELAKIDAALQRARDGHYGLCEVCGAQIAAARISAHPEAICCVACEPNAKMIANS